MENKQYRKITITKLQGTPPFGKGVEDYMQWAESFPNIYTNKNII